MRKTAPLSARRSSRGELPAPLEPLTSTIDIDVISADTEGTGARVASDERSITSDVLTTGALDDDARPLIAAAYSMPLSSKRSARISWNGESRSTNALP